jgi:hypothetical protein
MSILDASKKRYDVVYDVSKFETYDHICIDWESPDIPISQG